MSGARRFIPSRAMLVAVVALVAALAGTAVADVASTSKLSKGDKKQVTKIAKKQGKKQGKKQANKQIDKRESSLSVAEADKLDGKDASELQTSSGQGETGVSGALPTASFKDFASTTVTTTGTRIVANASVELSNQSGNNSSAECKVLIDGVESPNYTRSIPGDLELDTLSFTYARTVSAGAHPVLLQCKAGGADVEVDGTALTAVGVGE